MKIFISVFFLLTSVVSLLILVGKKMGKPFKSCGESCECIDEVVIAYTNHQKVSFHSKGE